MQLYSPKILAVGDSITYDTVSTLVGAYRFYLGEPFSQWYGANVKWVGENVATSSSSWAGTVMCGASGQRTDQINSTYDPGGQVLRGHPGLVIVHIGTNDMIQLDSGAWVGSVAESVSNLSTLLTTMLGNNATLIACVCKLVPNKIAAVDANVTALNAAVEIMLAAHIYTARIFMADCNAGFRANASWATQYMADNNHPNDAGKSRMATDILTAIQANISSMPRTVSTNRRVIRPHTAALRYATSTETTLGSGVTLNSTMPWAVSMDINLERASLVGSNGIWCLRTDQATPFVFFANAANARYFDFGSSANFDRFFVNTAVFPDVRGLVRKGWHQILLTFDGVDRTLTSSYKLYMDGANMALTDGAGLAVSTDQNAIGATVSGSTERIFDMADFTVWNGGTAMTAAQALSWFYDDLLPTGPTLIRRYKHTDASGSVLTDSTGNQNGTIGAATWITDSLPTMARTAATERTAAIDRSAAV